MTDDAPPDYDKEYTARGDHRTCRRLGIDTERGEVRRFMVQLEYLMDPIADEWAIVVRYDHDAVWGVALECTACAEQLVDGVAVDGEHADE